MTGSEVLARWSTFTPAERDAWVGERCMAYEVGWLYYPVEGTPPHHRRFDGGQEWRKNPWPDVMRVASASGGYVRGLRKWSDRVAAPCQVPGYSLGNERGCDIPPFTEYIQHAITVAEKLVADSGVPFRLEIMRNPAGLRYRAVFEGIAEAIQPTPAAAICLAGLAYVEGGEG